MALTSHFSSRRETHRLCTMKCWFSPSCKDCVISSFRSLIPRPRFSLAANGLPLQLPSSLLLPDDKRPPHWSDHLLFYFTCFFNFSPEYVNFYLICFDTDKKKCNYVYEIIFNRHGSHCWSLCTL